MSINIVQPNLILMSPEGEEVSRHRSPEEAMEKASELGSGEYKVIRPDATITVTGLPDSNPEPESELPPVAAFLEYIAEPLKPAVIKPLFVNDPHQLTFEQAKSVLVYVTGTEGPVTFKWLQETHTENSAPFHIAGDDQRVSFPEGVSVIEIQTPEALFSLSIEVSPEGGGEDPEPESVEFIPFTQEQFPQSYYDPEGKIDEIKSKFHFLPRDENGWTIITPSPANLVAYVDRDKGDDAAAVLVPQGTDPADIVPFKTLPGALGALPITRSGDEMKSGAHHVLLHDDQSFSTTATNHTRIPSGESFAERLVIGRYGDGAKPPVIDDFGRSLIRFWGICRFVIFQGVDLYNKFRDPHHPEFVGWGNTDGDIKGGIQFYSGEIGSSYILLEGSNMNYCSPKFSGQGHLQIIAHRCMVRNTYSETTHQQGWYGSGAREIMFDDCIFDHDGWFKQREKEIKLNTKAEGRATYFNHNMYVTNAHYLWIRNPIFMRASSIGTKLTSNGEKGAEVDSITASHILIENPYYLEGEIGISAGGNTDHNTGHRWNHIYIIDPIFESIGHSQPTNRTLAWNIDIQDWDKGALVNPLFIGSDNDNLTNTYGINVAGHCDKIKILNAIAYNIGAKDKVTGAYVIRYREQGQSNMADIIEEGTIVYNPSSKCRLLSDDVVDGITRKNCVYWTNKENKDELFKFDEVYLSIDQAMAHSSMQDCQFAEPVFESAPRTIKTYMASLGLEPTVEAFAAECGKQNIKNWRPEFTAQAVNEYLREGYKLIGLKVA